MKRAQIAYEFLIILFLLSLAFTSWIMIYNQNQANNQEKILFSQAQELAREIQQITYTTAMLDEDFQRNINIPATISGNEYEIETDKNTLTITVKGVTTTYQIPNTTGAFKKGENTISNMQTQLCIENEDNIC